MSSRKLAGIIIACTAAIIATIVLVTSPPLRTTNETEDYVRYVASQHEKALNVMRTLGELADKPQPNSLTWQHETTNCMEQLEQIKAELTATLPPKSLSAKDPETAEAIYKAVLNCLRHLTRAGYLLLDYAHAKHRGDVIMANSYMNESLAELDRAKAYQSVLLFFMKCTESP